MGNGEMDLLMEGNFKQLNESNKFDKICQKIVQTLVKKLTSYSLQNTKPITEMEYTRRRVYISYTLYSRIPNV